IGLYGFAAVRYAGLYRRRRRTLLLAVAVAYALLAEAMAAIVLARTWHATWWEWHGPMLGAVATLASRARLEDRGAPPPHGAARARARGGVWRAVPGQHPRTGRPAPGGRPRRARRGPAGRHAGRPHPRPDAPGVGDRRGGGAAGGGGHAALTGGRPVPPLRLA